jgi:hypothetical protein
MMCFLCTSSLIKFLRKNNNLTALASAFHVNARLEHEPTPKATNVSYYTSLASRLTLYYPPKVETTYLVPVHAYACMVI